MMNTINFLKRSLYGPCLLTLLIATGYVGFIIWQSGGPLGLVLPGTQFSQQLINGTEGYDGQFVYYIAVDPGGALSKIDVPAYRYQRIVYPLLARLLGFGSPELILWTLPLINLMALVVCVWVVGTLLSQQEINPWYALVVGLYAGQLLSVRVDLPEPLALALSLGGVYAFTQKRLTISIILLAIAALTKESNLLFAAGCCLYLWWHKKRGEAILFGGLVIMPFLGYQIILWQWLGQPGLGSGGAGATPFELFPFGGFIRIADFGWQALALFGLILGPIVILPTVWSIWVSLRDILVRHQDHLFTFILLANAIVIPFIPFSTYREPLAMLRITVPLVACVILYGGVHHSNRILLYSNLWLFCGVFLIKDPFI